MLTDGLIIALLVSGALLLMAYRFRSMPLLFVSSLGWLISGMQVYQQTAEILPMGLLMMLAIGQFFLIKGAENGS